MKIFSNRIVKTMFVLTLVFGTFAVVSKAQEMEKKDGAMMKKEETKPTVAIIKANWCGACKKLDPTMMKLMEEYKDKLNFVILDVTDETTSAKAMETAKEKGLEEFFNENKEKTSTVAIFKAGKRVFKTQYNQDREAYVKEFEKALK
jgi:thiol-disulfide isomerase/thioredoxin